MIEAIEAETTDLSLAEYISPEVPDEAFWGKKPSWVENIFFTISVLNIEIASMVLKLIIFGAILSSPLIVTWLLGNLPKEIACVTVGVGLATLLVVAGIATNRHD